MEEIQQQSDIRAFLQDAFGADRGGALFAQQETQLQSLLRAQTGKSQSQMKTLTQRILPCIALYQALAASGLPEVDAVSTLQRYMLTYTAAKQHASTARIEKVPGFYFLYSHIFCRVMRTSDLWRSTQKLEKASFDVTITDCLWHTACVENGCAELCRLFCDVDNVTYGGLKKIGFSRTQTLGYGGHCCDFHFYKK